jgi:hypothetical protein
MKKPARLLVSIRVGSYVLPLCFIAMLWPIAAWAQESALCLDGFCIGQTIQDLRFDKTEWILPKKDMTKDECNGVGCQPANAFRGYTPDEQVRLSEAVSWKYGLNAYNVVTKENLATLRYYKYECNASARGIWGERRFIGVYRSIPSQYLTIVGLRLIDGELTVYRMARQYPYHNQTELVTLAKQFSGLYGKQVLLYDYLSSNAYTDVIAQNKDGWFARSTMFNPTDLSDNAAELVLVDPRTRTLLQPSSMPESGEIKPLPVIPTPSCSRALPIQ